MSKARIALLVSFVVFLLSACASNAGGPVTVRDAWARPEVAGGNSAVYFVIDNPGAETDLLLGASTEAATRAEIHMSMQSEEGAMRMSPQESVAVPAGASVAFQPGGLHVMLVELKRDLEEGDQIVLRLTFQNAGEIQLRVPVRQRP